MAKIVSEYTNLNLRPAGVRPEYLPMPALAARFNLDADVSILFPFLNAETDGARWFETPEHVRFCNDKYMCNLFPRQAIAGPFTNKKEAHAFATILIDYLNDLHTRRETLTPDFRRDRPISVIDAFKLLPRSNCGNCGFVSCFAFAAALRRGDAAPQHCHALQQPVRHTAEYPVRDDHGNVISTITLDFDAPQTPQSNHSQAKRTTPKKAPVAYKTLTPRETQVLHLLAQGHTNTNIAAHLDISPHTVKSHIIHIFNKLGVNDRTSAAVWATQNNIV